jgi:hypothetical protein
VSGISSERLEGLKLNFSDGPTSLPRFWQRRFYDFNLWRLKKENRKKLHYRHMNPFKRGLPAHPKDWSWSCFSFYSKSTQASIHIDPIR